MHLQPAIFDSLGDLAYSWGVIPATGWQFTAGSSAGTQFPVIDFTQFGTYQVYFTVIGNCGSHTDTMQVSLTEEPELVALGLAFKDTLVCPGTSLSYKAGANLGATPYQFEWGSWSHGTQVSGISFIYQTSTAILRYLFKVTDALGCYDSTAFKVSVLSPPVVDAGNFTRLCYTDSVQLNGLVTSGTAPFNYTWSPGAGLSDSTILNPWRMPLDSSVTYTLTVTDSLGCEYSDTVTIGVFPQPNFSAGNDFTICVNQGDTLLTGATPQGGIWSGQGISTGFFSPSGAGIGNHELVYQYTDNHGCSFTDTVLATVIAQPNPNFGMDSVQGCSPLTVSFTDSSGSSFGHSGL
ncbi:MAG: hypothetical protein U5L96_09795 [Owenweeksia sp.]|nr:hypothetical protein [Owenweeksia sp.]